MFLPPHLPPLLPPPSSLLPPPPLLPPPSSLLHLSSHLPPPFSTSPPTSLPLHFLPVAVQRLHPVHRLFVPTQQAQLTVGVAVLLLIQCVRICLSVCGVCGKIGRHADGQTDRQTDTDRWIQQTPTKWCLGYSVRYSMWHRRD